MKFKEIWPKGFRGEVLQRGERTDGRTIYILQTFVCVEVLRPSQPNGVMSSAVSLPNHTFTGQA